MATGIPSAERRVSASSEAATFTLGSAWFTKSFLNCDGDCSETYPEVFFGASL